MLTPKDFASVRLEYHAKPLLEEQAGDDPFALFSIWLGEAIAVGIHEPNAMTLATVDERGRPSARIVLMKGFDERGLTFFTSYLGRKANELASNARAAVVFFWEPMHRQVRIEGTVDRTTREESEEYFHSRPRESQLAAWSAEQSAAIASRDELERSYKDYQRRFAGGPVSTPPTWGGFRMTPSAFEFWQGRPNRLHDRLQFVRSPAGWNRARLAP